MKTGLFRNPFRTGGHFWPVG